jgi:hypothetical protein
LDKGYSSYLVTQLKDLIKSKYDDVTVKVFTKRVFVFVDTHIDDVGVELYYNDTKKTVTLSLYANYSHNRPEVVEDDESKRPLYLVNDFFLNVRPKFKRTNTLNVDHDDIKVTTNKDRVLINGTEAFVLPNSRKDPVKLSDLQLSKNGKTFGVIEKAFNHPIMAVIKAKLEEAFNKTVYIKNRIYTTYERDVEQVRMFIVVDDAVSVIMVA